MIIWKDGELTDKLQTLYTVPASKTVIVHSVEFVNTNVDTRNVDMYLFVNGNSRRILPVLQELKAGFKLEDDLQKRLTTGSMIKAIATGSGVTYVIQIEEL